VFKITELFGVPKEDIVVGVVGSAGSIGSMSAELIAERRYKELVLIDIPRKMDAVTHLAQTLQDTYGGLISTSDSLSEVSRCDIIITATNTPEALITKELVRAGQVYIDDAQPSDIDHDVLTLPDVLVLEAGVVHTPGVQSNFHYGLKHKTDNFCCMAELLILASNMWDNHYVVHRATREHVRDIAQMGEHLGFEVASFQNFLESISPEKLARVKQIFQHNHGVSS
jgi:predicted amino acid dehydrogenase